jgi:hypothetical protein
LAPDALRGYGNAEFGLAEVPCTLVDQRALDIKCIYAYIGAT